jgi:hypothetical protein
VEVMGVSTGRAFDGLCNSHCFFSPSCNDCRSVCYGRARPLELRSDCDKQSPLLT